MSTPRVGPKPYNSGSGFSLNSQEKSGLSNCAFGKRSSCLGDTCHFHHFRHFPKSEEQNPCFCGYGGGSVRSEKPQNESSPNFSNFRPEFCPEFCSEFYPNFFLRSFRASFMGNGNQKKFTKNPHHLSMQPRQKKQIHKSFLESGRSKNQARKRQKT